ncbi:hypothetical protein CAPTEDRAFT_199599, partial [Capitella teleta]
GKCGLFSLLPPPKNATVKESGRTLLPHNLKKPKPTATKPLPPPAQKSVFNPPQPAVDSDSEGEGEAVNFFSIDEQPSQTAVSDGVSSSSESFADNPLQINETSKPFGPMRPEARQPLSDAEVYPEYSQIEDDVLPDSSSYPEAEDVGALQHDQQ